MSSFRRRITILFIAACIAITLLPANGCGPSNTPKASRKVAGILFQEDQFFRLILFGMRDAARRDSVELLEANSTGKPDREIELVNTYIANNVDAIVISPLSAVASMSALSRAKEKGITIITYNTTVSNDIPTAYIESDQTDLGTSTGKAARAYIEKRLNGTAQIAILAFQSQAPEQSSMRTKGFKDEVTKLPGVRVVAEQDAWLPEQAVKKVGDILTANPGVNIIWSANEGGTIGAVMAVRNAGKAGKVAVFGTDTGDQIAGFLLSDDNILQAVTGQQPFTIGSMAVDAAVRSLKGEKVNKRTSLPGMLLSREDPEAVTDFRDQLREMSR